MDRSAQLATIFLGIVAAVFAMVVTKTISAPMVLALALGVVLAPISDYWERIGFSSAAGALSSLVVALCLIGGVILLMQPVAMQLIDAAPKVWDDLQGFMDAARSMFRGMTTLSNSVAEAVAPAATAAPDAPAPAAPDMPLPSLTDALMLAPAILGQIMTFAGTLFFFLLSRSEIYDFSARRLTEHSNRAVMAQRLRAAEKSVSRYFLTITTINAIFGLMMAAILAMLGMPGASMWGTLVFILNFIVYLGPAVLFVGLVFAGVAAFDGAMVLAPAAAFLAISAVEGQFITPLMIGRNVSLNPLVVFVAIVFGIWIWGPIGGVVAIPLLVWARVLHAGVTKPAAPPVAVAATA